MGKRRTPNDYGERSSMENDLRLLQNRVNEFESFLMDRLDIYEEVIATYEDEGEECPVQIVCADYDEQRVDLTYALATFLDEVSTWQRRLAKAKVRWVS